jgi:hypothetical protein
MRTYFLDQWMRLWFLGGPDHVEYRHPDGQLKHSGAPAFALEMGRVWRNMAALATPDARFVIQYGGIHNRAAEPMDVLKQSLVGSSWKIVTVRAAPDSEGWRRQARQFGAEPKKAITEHDIYCRRA